jgi:hypothetical protein
MTAKKRTAMTPGLVIAVPLGDDDWGYGRLLRNGLGEFVDLRTTGGEHPDPTEIAAAPSLFIVGLMMDVLKRSDWEPLGVVPLSESEQQAVHRFFKQDPLSKKLSVYWTDPAEPAGSYHEEPATWDEVQGLERLSGWSAVHVESRLRDHFAGTPNKFVESLAPSKV